MKKLIASAFLVIALFGVSMVCASAVAQDPSTGNGFTVVGTAHFVPYSGEVDTASALSDIVAALMSSDQALDYLSVYNSSTSYVFMPNYVVNIKYNSTHNCYGIFLTSKSYSGWLHTGSATAGRYMIYCPPEKFEPDLLYSISRATSAISSKVSTISGTLTDKLSTISTTLSSFQGNVQNALVKLYSKVSNLSDAATGYFDSQVYSDLPTMFSRMAHDYYYGTTDERTAISAAFDRYWLTSMSSGKSYVSPEVLNDICSDLNTANIRCSVYYDADLGLSYIKGLGGPYIVDPSDWNPSGAAYEALSTSNRIFAVRELAVVSSNRNLSYYAAQVSGRLLKTVDNVRYTVADLQYNTWQQAKNAVTKLGSIDTRLSTLHTDATGLAGRLDNIADLLSAITYTCGYKTNASGTAYPTQTIPYNMAVQIAARINSEMLGKQMTVIKQDGSGTTTATISRCLVDSSGYIIARSASAAYYLCGKDNTIFVASQDYVKSIYSRLSDVISAVNNLTVGVDLSDVHLSVDASSINLFNNTAYCCGYQTDADGNLYPTLPIPFDSAAAILERLNTDYVDKKITVFSRSGAASSGYLRSASITSNGYIRIALTNGYTYFLCDNTNVLYLVDASSNYGSRANDTLTGISSQLVSTQTSIENALSTIIDKMDNLPASVDNIVVNITEDNSAYNIFYVEDENGDKKSVTSVAGDSLSASGKLLQFLYKLIIGGAISDVDNSIGGLNDFFFDNAPSGLGEGVTVWD